MIRPISRHLAGILEVANQFLLLGVDRNDRIANRLKIGNRAGDVIELGVTILMRPAFAGHARRLQAETLQLNAVASHSRISAAAMQRDLLPLLFEAARELRPLL